MGRDNPVHHGSISIRSVPRVCSDRLSKHTANLQILSPLGNPKLLRGFVSKCWLLCYFLPRKDPGAQTTCLQSFLVPPRNRYLLSMLMIFRLGPFRLVGSPFKPSKKFCNFMSIFKGQSTHIHHSFSGLFFSRTLQLKTNPRVRVLSTFNVQV